MDLLTYTVFSTVYILLFQLALNGKNEMGFDFFLMIGTFVLGGAVGAWMGSYETGFVIAMTLSFLYM
ncbi:MAG: hypothetical protein N2691_05430 [Patescibacteria group bacterium]|nr:hypothetical protein [Patescibacteria group bacterium]